jgi:hypothetical protein
MLLICYDPSAPPDPSEPPTLQPEHAALEKELRDEGRYVSGAALMPLDGARVVRTHRGEVVTTDGPFAETREAVGGYYIVECDGREEASRIASRIPVGGDGWIQVRRIALFHPNAARITAIAGST